MGQLSEGAILCTVDVIDLYPTFLDAITDKKVTTKTLVELSEVDLKNNIFQFNEKTLKQLRGTIGGILMIYFLSGNMEKIL